MALSRVVRLVLFARWARRVPVVCVLFGLTSFAFGQAQESPTAIPKAETSSSSIAQPAQSSVSNGGRGTQEASISEVPTAAQIQAAAEKDRAPSDKPDSSTLGVSPVAEPAAKSLVHGGNATIKPKYDVALIGQRNVGAGINFYSLDREIALGRQLSQEVEASSRLITDPVVTEYVNRLGQNLVRNSDARVPFTIKVLDAEEVNAFALPGGFFYVDSGLILAADNEAELAGVMAHEIAHVAARHATKNMTKAQIWNMAQIPLMVVGGPVAYAISEVAGLAVPLGFLKFSRDAEREADLLGLEYDYATGYDPHAFVEFFEKLKMDEKHKHNAIAKAFSTHPMNNDRIHAAQNEIRNYLPDRPEYVLNTSEFVAIKERLYMLENAHHIGGAQDRRRPVLMRRTGGTTTSDPAPTTPDGSSSGATQDDDARPTLTRPPAGTSGKGPSSGSQPPTGTIFLSTPDNFN